MNKAKFDKKTDLELQKELVAKRATLREFRFGVSGSKVKNTQEGRNVRKDIARILTELAKRNA